MHDAAPAQVVDGTLRPVRLSKSKIAAFEHCPRRLWLQVHRREAAAIDVDTLDLFQFGHDVGALAQFALPSGIMVAAEPDIQAALDRTAELIAAGPERPIFEATFQYEDVLVRVDILEPDGLGGWRAIEVKASTRVKSYQLADLATQVWVMRGCGVPLSACIIRHIARPFCWPRRNIATVRFEDADVTRSIRRYVASRAKIAAEAQDAVSGPEVQRDMGSHCESPFICEFRAHCHGARMMPLLATLDTRNQYAAGKAAGRPNKMQA